MLVKEIVADLKTRIALGGIGPGEKLPTPEELQKQFGAGKSTIREAIKILEGMGLVTVRKGRSGGTFATKVHDRIFSSSFGNFIHPDFSNLLDYIEYRRLIEPNLIRMACVNRTEKHLEKMHRLLNAMKKEAKGDERLAETAGEFIAAFTEATGNAFAKEISTHHSLLLANAYNLLTKTNGSTEITVRFFEQVLEAISDKDGDKGHLLADAYFVSIEERVRDHRQKMANSSNAKSVVKWGVIGDLSGPTSSHGKQTITGMMDAAKFINDSGGIGGKRLELVVHDSEYLQDKAALAYHKLTQKERVAGLYLQSTGATLSLAEQATSDRTLMFTAALSDKLSDPAKHPYHFSLGPTYADMARICIKYMSKRWTDTSRNPRLVFIYPDNSYGRDPLDIAKPFAEKCGMEVGPDQTINWPTLDATPQLRLLNEFAPDFIFVTSTAMHAAAILRDSIRLGIKAKFFLNVRAFNEELPRLAMGAAEGVYGIQSVTPYGADVPGMKKVIKAHEERNLSQNPSIAYLEGWANILAPMEGCRIAAKAGSLSADGIKDTLETMGYIDLGGLLPPIKYSPTDHSGCTKARISHIEETLLVPITDYIDINEIKL